MNFAFEKLFYILTSAFLIFLSCSIIYIFRILDTLACDACQKLDNPGQNCALYCAKKREKTKDFICDAASLIFTFHYLFSIFSDSISKSPELRHLYFDLLLHIAFMQLFAVAFFYRCQGLIRAIATNKACKKKTLLDV